MYNKAYHIADLSRYRFLVTGGAGFIGSNIVEYLVKYNAGKVCVLDNLSTGSLNNIDQFQGAPGFEFMKGDIRDVNVCREAMKGIDYVLHQAALGSVPRSINDPLTTNEVNISGFLNVMLAAREAGVQRMVYAASSSTYGDHPGLPKTEETIGNPLSPYAVTKLVNELYAGVFSKVYGFHTIGLRYFNVFGPRQSPQGQYAAVIPLFIEAAIKNQSPVIYGDGETSRDFTFVENVVQSNLKALFSTNLEQHEVVNIAFGERTTLNQLWRYIAELTATNVNPVYKEGRKGDVKHSLASVEKATKLFNYKPEISVTDGLKIAVEWYHSSAHR